uniref:Glutathione transferase n=1 Tax=Macrostomum lignano TaxID=282301 RepID=A0A1I8FC92_9PLAT
MSNQQQPANIIFESSKTLGVWGAGAAAQAQPAHSVLHAVLPVRPAHPPGAAAQAAAHQIVNLNLVRKPDWFLAKSASGKSPATTWRTRTPEPPLYPGDARKRAAMRLAVGKMGDSVIPAFYRWAMRRGDEQKAEWESLLAGLTQLQAQLGDSNFFGDCDQVQMADLMIWPWIERLPVAAKMLGFQLPADRFDKLLGWTSRMEQQRAVKETRISDDVHAAFFKAYWAKEPLKAGTGSSRGKNVLMETAKHLESGEPEPQLKPNLLTLYSMRFCPFAQRTRLVLQHKQLPHQIVNLNLVRKRRLSASGKVPALQEPDGSVLEDSLVTSRHLEETHRESALYPSNADKRAQMDGVIAQMGEKAAFEQLVTELESMQSTLGDSKFFAGSESVQMADLMIWPWFERLKPSCSLAGFQVPEERLKSLMSWMGRMEQQRAVLETRNTDEAHVEFTRSLLANQPKYDGY